MDIEHGKIDFAAKVEIIKQQAESIINNGDEAIPVFIIFGDGENYAIPFNDVPKDAFKPIFTSLMRKLGASAYIQVTEAYASLMPKDSENAKLILENKIQVRDLPMDDRQDIVCLIACERGKSVLQYHAKIDTDAGNKRTVGKWQEPSSGEIKGRLVIESW